MTTPTSYFLAIPQGKKLYHAIVKPTDKPIVPVATLQSFSQSLSQAGGQVQLTAESKSAKLVEFYATEAEANALKQKGLVVRESHIFRALYIDDKQAKTIKAQGLTRLDLAPTKKVGITLMENNTLIGVDKVWQDPNFDGGRGLTLCVVDTGMTNYDKRFGNRIARTFTAPGIGGEPHWHARWVASIWGRGVGQYDSGKDWRGVCYNATFFDARVLDGQGYGTTGTVGAGFMWGTDQDPDQIGMSLGGAHDQTLDDLVNQARAKGIVVTGASGNSGTPNKECDMTLNCPGDAIGALAVGATSGAHGTEGRELVQQWSSRNPALVQAVPEQIRYQPNYDVTPGLNITVDSDGQTASGTSGAQPFKAGAISVLIHKIKRIHADWTKQQRCEKAIEVSYKTSLNLGYDGSPNYPSDPNLGHDDPGQPYRCIQGYGRIQVDVAYDKIDGEGPIPSKIDKVEFYANDVKIGETVTPSETDTFALEKALDPGEYLWKGRVYSGNLLPVDTEPFKLTVVKGTPVKKIVASNKAPPDNTSVPEGTTIPFKVSAKLVEGT